MTSNHYKGKRIAALDYGRARIGLAVTDELHITVSTRPFIVNNDDVMNQLCNFVDREGINVLVVGVPLRHDEQQTEMIEEIQRFIQTLRSQLSIPIVEMDEAFSTARAHELMRVTGTKKKRRSAKGKKDEVAAAIILKDFLEENNLE